MPCGGLGGIQLTQCSFDSGAMAMPCATVSFLVALPVRRCALLSIHPELFNRGSNAQHDTAGMSQLQNDSGAFITVRESGCITDESFSAQDSMP